MGKIDPIDRAALLDLLAKYRAMPLDGHTFKGGKIHPVLQEMRQAALCDMEQLLRAAPTLDVQPVRRGEWKLSYNTTVNGDRWSIDAICSECFLEKGEVWAGFFPSVPPEIALDTVRNIAKSLKLDNFCPNCGADMRGTGNE